MSFLGDVLGFEKVNLKEIGRKIKENPERLLIGAVDPASSKVWSKVTGQDYEPIVDQWGGAASDVGNRAEASGVDPQAGMTMHKVARLAASIFGGRALAGKLGSGTGEAAEAGKEASMASRIGSAGKILATMGNSQQQEPIRLDQDKVRFDPNSTVYPAYAASSKTLKTPVVASMSDAIARGARSEHPTDSNGVEIAAIQELNKRIADVRSRIKALQGEA